MNELIYRRAQKIFIKNWAKSLIIVTTSLILFLMMGCKVIPIIPETNQMSVAQEKILKRDYDGARITLSKIYEKSELKTEKGEALYWMAYTHIKESAYTDARNYLETAATNRRP